MERFIEDKSQLSQIFNQTLVDCLPGVFYLYQIDDGQAKMKMWNVFHEKTFGYSRETYYDKSPYFYLDPDYHEIIKLAIKRILEERVVKQVVANIITKEGRSIPFIFEGYRFDFEDKVYFTGLGLDISELISAKEQINILALEKEKILEDIIKKEKELLALALQENQNQTNINDVLVNIKSILNEDDQEVIRKRLVYLQNSIKNRSKVKDNWDGFKELFINIHKDFFSKLKERHPNLTKGEIRFCAFLKINMSSNDLYTVLNISKNGLKKKRYRLNKKLKDVGNFDLESYIRSI